MKEEEERDQTYKVDLVEGQFPVEIQIARPCSYTRLQKKIVIKRQQGDIKSRVAAQPTRYLLC